MVFGNHMEGVAGSDNNDLNHSVRDLMLLNILPQDRYDLSKRTPLALFSG
jgi:hypothetical protein